MNFSHVFDESKHIIKMIKDKKNNLKNKTEITNEILSNTLDKKISCKSCYDISNKFAVPMDIIGEIVNDLDIKLHKCQLGLFGYPEKKIIKPAATISSDLEKTIKNEVLNNKISCKRLWKIARNLKIEKIQLSSACEAMSIKIKPCQLGAF